MDKNERKNNLKARVIDIVRAFPDCIELVSNEKGVSIDLAYPLKYEYPGGYYYSDYLKHDTDKEYQESLKTLIKLKRFLKSKREV